MSRANDLPAELCDSIAEAVFARTVPVARGEIIWRLVNEIYESVAWRDGDRDPEELASLRLVLEEADAHQARLVGLAAASRRASRSTVS